jgi:wobble nucleotide-excising tRNase
MILKFEKISSVGKFRDFTAKGDIAFNFFTLIYADNGCGKTTLASILRSLMNNDASIIRKRLSTNYTNDQAVQIYIKDSSGLKVSIVFGKTGWKNSINNFEIFDTHFVNENVYSGFEISDEHKKKLHQFVVGAQGVKIKNKILKNKQDKEQKKLELERIVRQIISKVELGLTEDYVKPFIKIKTTDAKDIDKRIAAATKELTNARAQKTISKYLELPLVDRWLNFDTSSIQTDIQATTKTIQDKALEKAFEKHLEELSNNTIKDPEDWLRTGFDYVDHKREHAKNKSIAEVECPFCKQELSSSLEILKAYFQIFNDDFNQYLERLQNHVTKVSCLNLDMQITAKNATKKTFDERVAFWKDYVKVGIPVFKVLSDKAKLKEAFAEMKTVVEAKAKNPSTAGKVKPISDFQTLYNQVNTNIYALNKSIGDYNLSIRSFKRTLKDIATAEQELTALQRIKKRFKKDVDDLCNDYVTVFKANKQLEEEYTKLAETEKADANKFISDYSKKINYYLKNVFQTPFQIKDMAHGSRRGKAKDAKVEYALTLDGEEISFDSSQPFSVSDCLSEGDKSTIAFSFFLSKLEIDAKLADKILVFDDPLTSLDRNRREITAHLISELSKKITQTIVLSHNESFLWELFENYDKSKRKVLRINQDFTNDTSFIEPLDIEFLVENKYFVSIKEMEIWMTKPDITEKDKVLGLIRNVLESHLRFKFFRQLNHSTIETFGKMIDKLEIVGKVTFKNEANRTKIISDLRLLNGVSWKPHHGEAKPNFGKLGVNPNTITDTALAKLVSRTFNLIDNEL